MLEKKEFFCLSDGWLLSTLLIIRKGKLQLKDILMIGNILNHAFFTLEEVNNGLSRLESENYIELKDGKFSLTEKSKNFVKKNKKHFEGCIDRQVRYSRILSDIPLSQSIVYKEYFSLKEYERIIQNYNC
mgnify:FL=1